MQETVNYSYNATWKDRLDKYGSTTLSYDAIGNVTNDGTWAYTWQGGRQLKSMAKSGMTVEYKYNHDGLRVQKKAGSTTTDYTLHEKLITHMKQGSANLHFYYDAQSRPAMVKYESGYYTYMHNLQGDIYHRAC